KRAGERRPFHRPALAFPNHCAKLAALKNFAGQLFLNRRYPVAIVAGLLLAAAFPKIGVAGFAWVAPALMLAATLGQPGKEAFRIGYVAGLAQYLGSLYWLLFIPYRWHGIPLGPAAGWLALSAYLAFYPAIWVWLVSATKPFSAERLKEREGSEQKTGVVATALEPAWIGSWAKRSLWALGGAAAWVALEMVVTRLFSGFP